VNTFEVTFISEFYCRD